MPTYISCYPLVRQLCFRLTSYWYRIAHPATYIDRRSKHSIKNVRWLNIKNGSRLTSFQSLMHNIRRIELLANIRPVIVNIGDRLGAFIDPGTHSEDNSDAEANGRAYNFAMAGILISAAFCTKAVSKV